MNVRGRQRVTLVQWIHRKPYIFHVNVMAYDENEAKKKAEITFAGCQAL